MKKIIIIALLISSSIVAQVKGNKKIETRTFTTENLKEVKINLYAKITIDQSLKEGMTISADANLFENIATEVVDGKLHLTQKNWVQPSQDIIIKIGAPNLERVEKGTHETLDIINVDTEYLNVMAFIGKVTISGKIEQLNIGIENGEIDASKLVAENARVNIWGFGKATVFAKNEVYSIVKNNGRLVLANQPKKQTGDTKKVAKRTENFDSSAISWIKFKIKNNSNKRNNFFVQGPKEDGSYFGYGFPLTAGRTKKENWSVGTKIYKVNKLGIRKLLVEIAAEDENKIVNLFQ